MSRMPLALRAPTWVLPRVPTMVISMLPRSLTVHLSPRVGRAVWHGRSLSSLQSPARIAWGKTDCEQSARTLVQEQGKDAIRDSHRIESTFFSSPTNVRLRQFCVRSGSANADQLLEDKAGDVTDSHRRTLKELCDGLVPRNFLEK